MLGQLMSVRSELSIFLFEWDYPVELQACFSSISLWQLSSIKNYQYLLVVWGEVEIISVPSNLRSSALYTVIYVFLSIFSIREKINQLILKFQCDPSLALKNSHHKNWKKKWINRSLKALIFLLIIITSCLGKPDK